MYIFIWLMNIRKIIISLLKIVKFGVNFIVKLIVLNVEIILKMIYLILFFKGNVFVNERIIEVVIYKKVVKKNKVNVWSIICLGIVCLWNFICCFFLKIVWNCKNNILNVVVFKLLVVDFEVLLINIYKIVIIRFGLFIFK